MINIVSHYSPAPSPRELRRVESFATETLQADPDLRPSELFRKFATDHIGDAPALHLDDLSEIPLLDRYYDVTFLQERARLRARDGDFVVTSRPAAPAYERYCQQYLGLGSPTWLTPSIRRDPLNAAWVCWTDRGLRQTLNHALRTKGLLYLHPHMGTVSVWELAAMLHRSSRRPVKVVAPPPALTKRCNNKLWFSNMVTNLFGEQSAPRTRQVCNLTKLARIVREFSNSCCSTVVLKLPDSAGGGGNLVLNSAGFRHESLLKVRQRLKRIVEELAWQSGSELMVSCWESNVLCAPSIQTWIPPLSQGTPIVEGLYEQIIEGPNGCFVGCVPAELPADTVRQLVNCGWLLAHCHQLLGYVGRCSFDAILIGQDRANAQVEFIECNGRWGGTSSIMSLMNRLFGDWMKQPYANRECCVPGLDQLHFSELLDYFSDDLFDARTGNGRLIFYNPGRMRAHSGINVLALADSWANAKEAVQRELPSRLRELVSGRLIVPN